MRQYLSLLVQSEKDRKFVKRRDEENDSEGNHFLVLTLEETEIKVRKQKRDREEL